MKRIVGIFLTLCHLSVFGYVPMSGPLKLADTVDLQGCVLVRGEIMGKLLTTRSLHPSVIALMRFDGVDSVDKLSSYQAIMQKIEEAAFKQESNALVEGAIEAIEYAIMYLYDDKIYIVGGYTPYVSVLFSGLRWRALNPFSYLNPWSWVVENHEKGFQLIAELEQLSDIARSLKDNLVQASRLKTTVFSYKHWRMIRLVPLIIAGLYISPSLTPYIDNALRC